MEVDTSLQFLYTFEDMHKRIFEKDLKVPNCKTIGSFFIYQGGCKFQMGLLRAANFFFFIFCFLDHVTLSCG